MSWLIACLAIKMNNGDACIQPQFVEWIGGCERAGVRSGATIMLPLSNPGLVCAEAMLFAESLFSSLPIKRHLEMNNKDEKSLKSSSSK